MMHGKLMNDDETRKHPRNNHRFNGASGIADWYSRIALELSGNEEPTI